MKRRSTRRDGGSVYKDIKAAGIPTDHHESDLYVLDTGEARRILERHGRSFSRFISQVDHKAWLDVPFAYEPFWEAKARSRLHRPGLAKAGLRDPDQRAWSLVSYGYDDEPMTVATFKDKGEAARRMARLKRSHPGARYELRRVRRAAHRLFESRSHRRSVTSRRDLDTPAKERAWLALQRAAERIGRAEHAAGRYAVTRRRGRVVRGYTISEAHRRVLEAMNDLGKGKITPEQAMAVLHEHDVLRARTSSRDPSAVWTVSLQVTSPSRPNLRHQLEYTVRASDREDAVEKAKHASRRDGNTVIGVVAVHKRGRRTGR